MAGSGRAPSDIRTLAGLRYYRRNPHTDGWVVVLDGHEANLDTAAGRWQTLCVTHGSVISHVTLALAREWLGADAADWCEPCSISEVLP